jgi:hypothetical protein
MMTILKKTWVGMRSRMKKKRRKYPLPTHPWMKKMMRTMSDGYRGASPFWRLMPKDE